MEGQCYQLFRRFAAKRCTPSLLSKPHLLRLTAERLERIDMNKGLTVLTMCLAFALPAFCVDRAQLVELNKKAQAFAKDKDWKAMRGTLLEIGQAMPAPTPFYMLRMASVETLLGNRAEALGWIRRYAAMGLTYDVNTDQELKPLGDEKDFKEIAATMQANSKAVLNAELVCSLPLADMMPEDLTFEKSAGTFVASSVQHHTLYRVSLPKKGSQECAIEEIPLEASAKHWPVFAVSADTKRNLLWMSASAVEGFNGVAESDKGKAALLAVNSSTGKVIRRFDLEASGPAVLGDMCVAEDGSVYVTDSLGGGVYRVQGDVASAKLEKIADGLFSPQTPVLASDGKRLFAADYSMGIAVIDVTKVGGKVEYLRHPENIAVTGLDGFYRAGDSLLGIQNGTEPERIVRLKMNPEQTEITSAEIVARASPLVGEATHAVAVDGMYYVSANVGWDKVDDHGQLKSGQQFSSPRLLRFAVK
jgi:sugar lactone lactonase YvrE